MRILPYSHVDFTATCIAVKKKLPIFFKLQSILPSFTFCNLTYIPVMNLSLSGDNNWNLHWE